MKRIRLLKTYKVTFSKLTILLIFNCESLPWVFSKSYLNCYTASEVFRFPDEVVHHARSHVRVHCCPSWLSITNSSISRQWIIFQNIDTGLRSACMQRPWLAGLWLCWWHLHVSVTLWRFTCVCRYDDMSIKQSCSNDWFCSGALRTWQLYSRCTHTTGAVQVHRVPKKGDTKLMAVTLSLLNRFSKFFHWYTQR